MGCLWAILYPAGRWKSKFCGREPQEEKLSTLSNKQIGRLSVEFPFLRKVVNTDPGTCQISTVKVEVADSTTLFIKPSFSLPPHYICSRDNKYVGHVYPHAYSINEDGEILNRISWNYETPDSFVKDLLVSLTPKPVKKLVVVMAYVWWNYIEKYYEQGLDTYVGEFSHYEYQVYIYKEPKQGFKQLKSESDLASNVRIDDLLSISMAARLNTDAKKATDEIDKIKAEFKNRIGQSMWKHINASKSSGMKGHFGNTELLTFCSAGRVMLTFNRGKDNFTLIGDESDWKRTGVQSMHCTVLEAKEMVSEVIESWSPSKLLDDKKVWFG